MTNQDSKKSDDLVGYDAIASGGLIRKGGIGPVELLNVTIQRVEKINPRLNALIHRMYDQTRETAEKWRAKLSTGQETGEAFCDVPFLLKDLLAEYRGAPFNEGSRVVKGYVSKIDSELVKRQKASGLNIQWEWTLAERSMPSRACKIYRDSLPCRSLYTGMVIFTNRCTIRRPFRR